MLACICSLGSNTVSQVNCMTAFIIYLYPLGTSLYPGKFFLLAVISTANVNWLEALKQFSPRNDSLSKMEMPAVVL